MMDNYVTISVYNLLRADFERYIPPFVKITIRYWSRWQRKRQVTGIVRKFKAMSFLVETKKGMRSVRYSSIQSVSWGD